jgi:hypothetical protein
VDVVKLEDFTRLSLAIPESAAKAVRVGASCRVNGAPLSVASVKERHDGLGVIASFGVALNSPLTSTLSTMTAGASVRLEVETEDSVSDADLDVVDVWTSKQMREMQDGLPGTREWYNQALPWYSKMYPPSIGSSSVNSSGRPFTEDDARLSRELGAAAADAGVDHPTALEDDLETLSKGHGTRDSNAHRSGAYSDAAVPPPPTTSPPSKGSQSRQSNGAAPRSPETRGGSSAFADSLEARIIDGWSRESEQESITREPPSKPSAREYGNGGGKYGNDTNDHGTYYDYYSAPDVAGASEVSETSEPVAANDREALFTSASLEVVSALENLARRNTHLTDRVEVLLEMLESKGFGDAEVMAGLKRLEESGKSAVENDRRASSSSNDDDDDFASASARATRASRASTVVEKETEPPKVPESVPPDSVPETVPESVPEPPKSRNGFLVDDDVVGPDAERDLSEETDATFHPGALCRTRSEIVTDVSRGSATITIHTSVKAVKGFEGKMAPVDFVAVGARSAARKASDLATERANAALRGETTLEERGAHETICRLLQNGKIVWVESMSEVEGKFGHPCYRLRIECHKGTGQAIEAVFKPKIEGDGDGWHRANMEYVAYKLSRMLGMDLVPPAAYRTGGIELDYKTFEEGAFMYWVDEAKELDQVGDFGTAVSTGCWGSGVDPRVVLSDTRVLDVLLQNSDRHSGHFLFGRHWTEGGQASSAGTSSDDGSRDSSAGDSSEARAAADGDGEKANARDGNGAATLGGVSRRPVLIDHAASFRPEAFVSMEHENAFQTGPTVCVKSTTYLRLRFLDAQAIEREFGYFLSADERRAVLERRDAVLSYLDDLVEKRGFDDVVIH